MLVELNISLPSTAPAVVIAAAKALRAHGFIAPAARVALQLQTGRRLLVLQASYSEMHTGSPTGVNGAVRRLAQALDAETISMPYGTQVIKWAHSPRGKYEPPEVESTCTEGYCE